MTTEQWERENQDTLMDYFIDGDPSVAESSVNAAASSSTSRPETANIAVSKHAVTRC